MRIVMINHFPLEGSGSGTYTKNLATQLVKLGHEVCIILPLNRKEVPQYEGVRLHPVYFTDPDHPELTDESALPFNFPCFTTHPVSVVAFEDLDKDQMQAYLNAFQQALAEEVGRFKPDVIHGQHVWALPSLAADFNVPLVLTAHGTDLMGYDKWPSMRKYADKAINACKKVICISKDNEQLVRSIFPDAASKIVRMRNGYNPDIFYPKSYDRAEILAKYGLNYKGEDIILFAGKMTRFKGIDVLLDAAALYESKCENALTILAGDGEERASLLDQAERLNLKRVHFIGNVSQEDLACLYNIADIDLVPSRREPFGLVAVEAMACGTPVVATNQGGLPDFVNESVGCLVNPEDSVDLAKGIVSTLSRALSSYEWRESIAEYANENYSQAAIIKELDMLYNGVCS